MPPKPAKQYRALQDMSLRAKPTVECDEWLEWKAGEVFMPPSHFRVDKALERGLIEEVKGDG